MRKYLYKKKVPTIFIVVISITTLLLVTKNAQAATSLVSTTVSTNSNTYNVYTQSYTNIYPINVERSITEINNVQNEEINATYTISYNVYMTLTTGKYYNGYYRYSINTTASRGEGTFSITNEEINNPSNEGISMTPVGGGTSGSYVVLFDNVLGDGAQICVGQITRTYTYYCLNPNSSALESNFTTTISIANSDLRESTGVENDALSAIIYSAVEQSTFQDFDQIIALLQLIYDDDLDAFADVLSALNTSNTWLNSINNWTSQIYTKVNNIDTNVGTILTDLQSYIIFMQTYIPYLSNISTNTLNTYQQLLLMYNYLINRPTIYNDFKNGEIYLSSNGKYYLYSGDTRTRRYIIIEKEQNIKYIYTRSNLGINYHEIFYFETLNYEYGIMTQVNPTRVIDLKERDYQYYTIDFKYNEKYCVVCIDNISDSINFRAYIGDGYIYSAITYYIDSMQNMNAEESSEAAAIESQIVEKESEQNSAMEDASVTMPDINNIDFDIDSLTDTDTQNTFFGFLSLIANNTLITTILIIAVTGIVAGYILYGKK